jgi:hypothetical protein
MATAMSEPVTHGSRGATTTRENEGSAYGGSAATQAASLPERSWRPRPVLAWSIRVGRTLFGLVVSVAAVRVAALLVGRPDGRWAVTGWLVLLATVSVAVVLVTDRLTRRLLPIATLLQLSLVFPDRAPARFSHALRRGSGRELRSVTTGAGAVDPSGTGAVDGGTAGVQEHAERLLHLVNALTAHDRRTRGHAERVRAYSKLIGEELGLDQHDLDLLNWGALLHDIGKLNVPAALLNKAGRPTAEEWEVLRTHPAAAAVMVEPLRPWLGDWVDAATQHHERFDGAGYPDGVHGPDISLAGRIVAVADAYDVMTSARSYKQPLSPALARTELSTSAGTQFDPEVVRALLGVSLGRLRWIVGPIGWLTQLPAMLQVPLTTLATSGGLAAISVLSALPTVVADRPWQPATEAMAPAGSVEQAAAPTTSGPRPAPDEPGVADRSLSTIPRSLPRTEPTTGSTTATSGAPGTAPTGPTSTAAVTTTPNGSTPTSPHGEPVLDPIGQIPPTTTSVAPVGATGPPAPTAPPPATSTTAAPTTAPTTTTAPPPATTTTTAPTTTTTAVVVVAQDDTYYVTVGAQILRVTDNDDAPGSPTPVLVHAPNPGRITLVGNHFRYTRPLLDLSVDYFDYRICSAGVCDEARVTVRPLL